MNDILDEFQDQLSEFEDKQPSSEYEEIDLSESGGRGLKGVASDTISGVLGAPASLAKWAMGVPKAVGSAVMHPLDALGGGSVAIGGLAGELFGAPRRIGDYIADISGDANFLQKMPKAWDEQDLRRALGLKGEASEGAHLVRDIASAIPVFRGGRAIKGLSGGRGLLATEGGSQALAGALGSALYGGNVAEGAALGSLAGGLPKPIDAYIQNRVKKSGLTPDEIRSRQEQYGDAPVDAGTVIDDPFLKSVYDTIGRTPVIGAGVRKSKAKRADMMNMQEWEQGQSKLSEEAGKARDADTLVADVDKLNLGDSETIVAESIVESLGKERETANKLYEPFDKAKSIVYTSNLKPLADAGRKMIGQGVPEFRFQNALKELGHKAANMVEFVGSDSAMGAKVGKALEEGFGIFENMTKPGAEISPRTVKDYIDTLRQEAAIMKRGGVDIPALELTKLADALTADTKQALRQTGQGKVLEAWEAASKHHKENILPFYESGIIRDTLEHKERPLPTSVKSFVNELNAFSRKVIDKLSPEARRAIAFEVITRGKGDSSMQANRSGVSMAKEFTNLSKDAKEVVRKFDPALFKRLQEASKLKRGHADVLADIEAHARRKPQRSAEQSFSPADLAGVGGVGLAGSAKFGAGVAAGGAFARALRKGLENPGNLTGENPLYRRRPRVPMAIMSQERGEE